MFRCLIIFVFLSTPVFAANGPNISYSAEYSYNEIGEVDQELSLLCGARQFNQRQYFLYRAYFAREKVLLGGAKGNGWNLFDPTNSANSTYDYWFKNDSYSSCIVFKVLIPTITSKSK